MKFEKRREIGKCSAVEGAELSVMYLLTWIFKYKRTTKGNLKLKKLWKILAKFSIVI